MLVKKGGFPSLGAKRKENKREKKKAKPSPPAPEGNLFRAC